MIFDSSEAGNNRSDTTEDAQRKLVHCDHAIRSPTLIGSTKDQGEVGTRISPKRVYEKLKRGRSATKHKNAENPHKNKNKYSKSKSCYRSTSSSSSTDKSPPSPKRHKSQRKKRKHRKCSSS